MKKDEVAADTEKKELSQEQQQVGCAAARHLASKLFLPRPTSLGFRR